MKKFYNPEGTKLYVFCPRDIVFTKCIDCFVVHRN